MFVCAYRRCFSEPRLGERQRANQRKLRSRYTDIKQLNYDLYEDRKAYREEAFPYPFYTAINKLRE